jgi:hypothetical protein
MNFYELMVKWGTLIWPAFVLIFNLILSLILKRFGKNPMKYQAEIALEHFFSCNEAIIVNEKLEVQDQHAQPTAETLNEDDDDEHPIEKAVVFVNTDTSNEYYSMNNRIVHFLFAGYYNTFVTYFGYFCIQTFFLNEKISSVCLDGYICEPVIKNNSCASFSNLTSGENFLCSQYRLIDTLDSFLVNLAVVRTVFALLVEINMTIYKLVRFMLTRNRCKVLRCCISQQWLIALTALSLGFVFVFWVGVPFLIFRIDSFLLTRSATSKLVSIVATSMVVLFTGATINMVHGGKKFTYMLYMEIKSKASSQRPLIEA